MAILFAGGEDFDLPNGAISIDTAGTRYRTSYARCALGNAGGGVYQTISPSFSATPLTGIWASCRMFVQSITSGSSRTLGVTVSTASGRGIYVTCGTGGKAGICTWDGTTQTSLATEAGTSLTTGAIHKIDLQIVNYGASGTVNVWVDGASIIAFTGNIAVSGVSGFNQVSIGSSTSGSTPAYYSEVIAADEDTRTATVITLAPNALGTTDQWTGTYTDVNETTLSDATLNVTNTVAQDQLYALADVPAGNFAVRALVLSARATSPAGSTATQLSLGVRSGSITDVAVSVGPGTGFTTIQRIMDTDPTTGLQWTTTSVNAVQLAMRSA